jgi:hypothetical protein
MGGIIKKMSLKELMGFLWIIFVLLGIGLILAVLPAMLILTNK